MGRNAEQATGPRFLSPEQGHSSKGSAPCRQPSSEGSDFGAIGIPGLDAGEKQAHDPREGWGCLVVLFLPRTRGCAEGDRGHGHWSRTGLGLVLALCLMIP